MDMIIPATIGTLTFAGLFLLGWWIVRRNPLDDID